MEPPPVGIKQAVSQTNVKYCLLSKQLLLSPYSMALSNVVHRKDVARDWSHIKCLTNLAKNTAVIKACFIFIMKRIWTE